MSKYDLKGIASALAAAHNISEEDAEKFLNVVCEVVLDALRHDGLVKIKGLGTFKLIGVPEREMVDVNTGERITVEARNRISFSPDAVLRDIINKPFIFFETVVLKDGVVFDDETEADSNDDEEDQFADDSLKDDDSSVTESEEEETIEEDVSKSSSENVLEVNTEDSEDKKIEKSTVELESDEMTVESVECADNEKTNKEQSSEKESVENKQTSELENSSKEPSSETSFTEESHEKEQSENVVNEEDSHNDTPQAVNEALKDARSIMDDIESGNLQEDDNQEDDNDDESEGSFFSRHLFSIFMVFVLIVGSGAFIYGLYGNEIMTFLGYNDDDMLEPEVVITDSTTMAVADSLSADSIKKGTVSKKNSQLKSSVKVKADTINPDFYDSLDIRVRTGAYRIVGIHDTVVVQRGQTFNSITKAYLGEGMECYMEVLNGVKSVKPGDSLKIPKLKWRKKRKK